MGDSTHRGDDTRSPNLWRTFFSAHKEALDCGEAALDLCGSWSFQVESLGCHLNTCNDHLGGKKSNDWMVEKVADLFRTTHKVKTQQFLKNRGHHCGDIELVGYLANEATRCHWCWTFTLTTTELGVALTLLSTDTCVTLTN